MNELNCEYVRDVYPDVLNGMADAATSAAVRAHMAGCADCREEAEAVAAIFAGSLIAPAGLHARVMAQLATPARRGFRARHLAMAATVAVALIGGSLLLDRDATSRSEPVVATEVAEPGLGVVTFDAALVSGTESLQDLTVEELEQLLGEIES
jgi:hypothetical protein